MPMVGSAVQAEQVFAVLKPVLDRCDIAQRHERPVAAFDDRAGRRIRPRRRARSSARRMMCRRRCAAAGLEIQRVGAGWLSPAGHIRDGQADSDAGAGVRLRSATRAGSGPRFADRDSSGCASSSSLRRCRQRSATWRDRFRRAGSGKAPGNQSPTASITGRRAVSAGQVRSNPSMRMRTRSRTA